MTSSALPIARRAKTASPTLDSPLPRGATLSAAEECSFARGDVNARDRLVRSNLGLVIKIARSYFGHGLDPDDLIAEGNIGLLRAAMNFDPKFNVRFSTYATYWIKMSICRALTRIGAPIRLPANMVAQLSKWRKAERELASELGHPPTSDQIATSLGLTESKRAKVRNALLTRHLDHESADDEGCLARHAAEPGLTAEAEIERSEERQVLRERMERRLDDRERMVITLRYGLDGKEPMTLQEVGRTIGVTRAWVRKIEIQAVSRLRDQDCNIN